MIYILDIANKIHHQLMVIANKIDDEFNKYKHEFGIGVTDAEITSNTIEFTLELLPTRLSEGGEHMGLYLISTVSFNFLVNNERIIKICYSMYTFGENIIQEREFIVHPYASIEEANIIVQSSINYIEQLDSLIRTILITKYLNTHKH